MLLRLAKFTGLSPSDSPALATESRASVCTNVNLRYKDIRPLASPVPVPYLVPANSKRLLFDGVSAVYGSDITGGVGTEHFRGTGAVYLTRNSVSSVLFNGSTLPVQPPTPTEAVLVSTVKPTLASNVYTTAIGPHLDKVETQEAAASPTSPLLREPTIITTAKALRSPVLYALSNYSVDAIMAAVANVLDNYSAFAITTAGNALPATPLRYLAANLVSGVLDYNTPETRLGTFITALMRVVVYDMTGVVAGDDHRVLHGYNNANLGDVFSFTFPYDYGTDGEMYDAWVSYRPATTVASQPYTPGLCAINPGYTAASPVSGSTRTSTLQYMGAYADVSFVGCYTDMETFIRDVLVEYAAAQAQPATYEWDGLSGCGGVLAVAARSIAPFTLGSSQLNSGDTSTQRITPRSYCYTFVDSLGRESQPSPVTTDMVSWTDTSNPVWAQTLRVATFAIPANVASVNVYKQIINADAASVDEMEGVWVLDGNIPPQQLADGYTSVSGYDGLAGLATLNDQYIPDPALFFRVMPSGHAVCTDSTKKVLYVSTRHLWHSFPYNRRRVMPQGITIENIVVVENTIYVVTNRYVGVFAVGEDKGEAGLQLSENFLVHADFGLTDANSAVPTGWGMLYSSRVGLTLVAGPSVTVVTEKFIEDDDWASYAPRAAAYVNGQYFAFRDDKVTIFDIPDPVFGDTPVAFMTQAAIGASAAQAMPDGTLLFLPPGSPQVMQWGGGAPLPVTYESYDQQLATPVVLSTIKVNGSGFNVSIVIYDETGIRWTAHVSDSRPHRTPHLRLRGFVRVRITGELGRISSVELASSMGELAFA